MAQASNAPRLLILGGTGFVGLEVCRQACALGWTVVAVSRRGAPPARAAADPALASVEWRQGDATQEGVLEGVVRAAGPFSAAFHALGALFDGQSGLGGLNRIVSGAGSVPDKGSSYDDLTRKTAFALADAVEAACPAGTPFVFVSAAEAGWPDVACGPTIEGMAPGWLKRYLAAKRTVEQRLLGGPRLRAVVLRPSFIWNWGKLDILPPVLVYSLLSAVRVPFVDRPVRVETLVSAALAAIQQEGVSGIKDSKAMRALAAGGRP